MNDRELVNYQDAIEEAERFIRKAKKAMEAETLYDFSACKYRAAAKRSSMDLTRALVKIRNRKGV